MIKRGNYICSGFLGRLKRTGYQNIGDIYLKRVNKIKVRTEIAHILRVSM